MAETTVSIESVLDEVIAKKPELAEHRDDLVGQLELMQGLSDQLAGTIEGMRDQIVEALPQIEVEAQTIEEARSQFKHWGIDPIKFAHFFGGKTEDDAWKLVQMTLLQDRRTTVEQEVLKTFVLARFNPTFDMLS